MSHICYVVRNEEDWHKLRGTCITASEAAIVIGADPYGSPGKLKRDTGFRGNANTIVGQLLEPVVVQVVNKVLKSSYELYETVAGKEFFIKGNLGATPDATDGSTLLECKTTRPDLFLKYKVDPPVKYLVQLQVQMWCTDIKEGYLAILSTDLTQMGGQLEPNWPICIYKVRRSDKLCAIIEQQAERYFKETKEGGKFRVCSKVKRQCGTLLHLSYEKVKSEIQNKLKEILK